MKKILNTIRKRNSTNIIIYMYSNTYNNRVWEYNNRYNNKISSISILLFSSKSKQLVWTEGGVSVRVINTGETIGVKRSFDGLGRIVVPKEFRDELDMQLGETVEVFQVKDGIFIKKIKEVRNESI